MATDNDRSPWLAQVATLLPEMFPGPLDNSLSGRALAEGVWSLDTTDLRAFGIGRHRSVDDTPAGGGPGMVLRPDVVGPAVDQMLECGVADAPLIYLSPRGAPLTQARVHTLASGPGVKLLCGRFEGLDQRVIDAYEMEEISIGDYILSGGEIAAMVLLDAVVRLLPGVIGDAASLAEESFENGALEYPHYTRPRDWDGRSIPEVLLSGDHKKIEKWRREQSLRLTRIRRPDLIGDE